VRSANRIAIAVASSGIAATLLQGGRTAHSAFKLPLNLNKNDAAICNITKQSPMAELLRDCKLIVWDECTMSHKHGLEALDRSLKDLRSNNKIMGGLTVVLAGDFRQTLPVIPQGTHADQIQACLKLSYLWTQIKLLSLRINMRVHLSGNPDHSMFSELLMCIGNGTFQNINGKIIIPPNLCHLVNDIETLCDRVYPDLHNIHLKSSAWFRDRAILAPKNEQVDQINIFLLTKFSSIERTYKSINTVIDREDIVRYPIEVLNSLTVPGIPQHELKLKVGAPIILL